MKVNSAKEYRTWFKNQEDRPEVDEDFMGCSYDTGTGKIKGFFNLFHGKKDNIEGYLPSLLDIAEDNQAIYEFLQNAVDCGATHFWAFYNDQYFLAVNNGSKFSLDGLSSILNIAQSTKHTASSIGRLGIGFKLAHRLVGKGNGTYELIHDNKGPIMFSWDNSVELKSLMSSEEIICEGLDENPFLIKIAITNFPANVGESVKNVEYKDVVAFPESELSDFRNYTRTCLESLFSQNNQVFNQGTLFFIKLGENKRKLLDDDLATLKNGIEYSMNTLKQLHNICFNGEVISKKKLEVKEASISKLSDKFKEIDPQYKEYDILYSFGFLPLDFNNKEYYKAIEQFRQSPNFYKYFPMGDEVDNTALFIHSDSFQIEANRRKLTNHHTNRELLPEIAAFIIKNLNDFKTSDKKKYLQLYASILLSDKPTSQEKSWMFPVFYDKLYAAIKSSVPIKFGISEDLIKVKIKKININLPLKEIGFPNIEWFAWDGDNNKELLAEAVNNEKLGIEEWNINTIIVKSDKVLLNKWLEECSEDDFSLFINEIKATTTSNDAKALLPQIRLFKIGDERKSYNEIIADTNYVLSIEKIAEIIPILQKIGMKCTDMTIENHPLSALITAPSEKDLYSHIKLAVETNASQLEASDKLSLISTLILLEGIAENTIKQLKIFKNKNREFSCLGKLISYKENVESWLLPYVICQAENFIELQKFMISDESIYNDIINEEYESIFNGDTTIDEMYSFYQKKEQPWDSSLTIKLIDKFGATDEILSLIEKTSDKDSIEKFIQKMQTLALFSENTYATNSFEYRCIQLAAKNGAINIRSKITVDGIRLSDFVSSDSLSFKVTKDNETTSYHIKLSEVLPNDKQCSIYGKISSKFSSIDNFTSIFSADSSILGNVSQRLKILLTPSDALITPAQYAYILLTRAIGNYSSLSDWQSYVRITNEAQIKGIISYFYENKLQPVLISFKALYPFRNYVQGKYLFSKDYTIESERANTLIEEWCGQDVNKKKYLIQLGMHFNDSIEIKRRITFKNDIMTQWDTELTSTPFDFLNWVSSIKPISGENQKILLRTLCLNDKVSRNTLKQVFDESDYSNAKELNSSKYEKWKNLNGLRIYTLATEMPYRVIYGNEIILCHDYYGCYQYFKDTKHLYIKGVEESEIAKSLADVYSVSGIPFNYEDYISVCFNSLEEQRENEEKLKSYEKLINELVESEKKQQEESQRAKEEYREKYVEQIKEFMGGDYSLPMDMIKSEHIIMAQQQKSVEWKTLSKDISNSEHKKWHVLYTSDLCSECFHL